MAKFKVTVDVTYRKTLDIYASTEIQANEKAVEIVNRLGKCA